MKKLTIEKEPLLKELISKYGVNLFLGAGFSVYSYNSSEESLPLGGKINEELIKLFSLDKSRNYSLSKTCQIIKKDNEDALCRFLKEKYTVKSYDARYSMLPDLPIKNIVTLNIDNLVEKIFDETSKRVSLHDAKIYGSLEGTNEVNIYKIHGSVTYAMTERLSFTEKEVTDLFIKEHGLFETVSYKLSTAPTIFWGTSLCDNNTLELICNSERFVKAKTQKWVVVYPDNVDPAVIEDLQVQGFNIIEADTLDLIEYLHDMEFSTNPTSGINYKYGDLFPNNYITEKLKKISVRRPVVDFFSGAEPQISDVLSSNVTRISYYGEIVNKILSENVVLITGIPGCGKSTLLLQLAFSDDIVGCKFWFSNITKQDAERLKKAIEKEKDQVIIFIDNLNNNMDAFKILSDMACIKLVLAERALNFDYIKRSFNIDLKNIIDISNLDKEDVQKICKSMNRTSDDAIRLLRTNKNISLLEIVFYASTKFLINERIKGYINDLRSFEDIDLKINLLELFALVNYTSYCGVPCTMDMLWFYFSGVIDSYTDILYALNKMSQIIVEADVIDSQFMGQSYLIMRSKSFAERSVRYIDEITMGKVLNQFWDKINPQIIYRYDILKRRAYDADLIEVAFKVNEGKLFYEKMLKINSSPFVKHQYAIFLLRKKKYDQAWDLIDQAYTESEKKVFTIANTHAVILFEMNIEAKAVTEEQIRIQKETLRRSFSTLGYCITQDARINYHVLVYSRNTLRYFERFGIDEYTKDYIKSSLQQLDEILGKDDYMYSGMKKELQRLKKEISEIKL